MQVSLSHIISYLHFLCHLINQIILILVDVRKSAFDIWTAEIRETVLTSETIWDLLVPLKPKLQTQRVPMKVTVITWCLQQSWVYPVRQFLLRTLIIYFFLLPIEAFFDITKGQEVVSHMVHPALWLHFKDHHAIVLQVPITLSALTN